LGIEARTSAKLRQRCSEDRTMFGFSTSAMRSSTRLERPDDCFINTANKQVSHRVLHRIGRYE